MNSQVKLPGPNPSQGDGRQLRLLSSQGGADCGGGATYEQLKKECK